MTKREKRELFFKAVFMTQFTKDDMDAESTVRNYLATLEKEEYADVLVDRVKKLCQNLDSIDNTLNSFSKGWKTSRMARVDLALLRVAVYEIQIEGLDKGIAINESVELAKEYGGERSYAFINGILGKVGN